MSRVPAVFVDRVYGDGVPPGAIKYTAEEGEITGFNFCCPCGCGGMGGVSFKPPHGWTWDGNREAPTVNPSVYFSRGEPGEWHGYLRAGVWESV